MWLPKPSRGHESRCRPELLPGSGLAWPGLGLGQAWPGLGLGQAWVRPGLVWPGLG